MSEPTRDHVMHHCYREEEAVSRECGWGECDHVEGDCPTFAIDACRECSDAEWDHDEDGALVLWEDCRERIDALEGEQ